MSRCELWDLPTDQCAHCRGNTVAPGEEPGTNSRAFEARYEGWCIECQERIEIGESLVMLEGRATHMECAE